MRYLDTHYNKINIQNACRISAMRSGDFLNVGIGECVMAISCWQTDNTLLAYAFEVVHGGDITQANGRTSLQHVIDVFAELSIADHPLAE